jgi:peptide/nickel transport system permease protein
MLKYIIRRLLSTIPVMITVALIAFFVTNIMPGDPARVMVGEFASESQYENMRSQLGLDRTVPERFFLWVKRIARGDMGNSLFLGTPVTQAIIDRLEPTMLLAVVGMFFGVLIGVSLGIFAAVNHRTLADQLSIVISVIGISVPNFFIAIMLILFFGLKLRWFPVAGYTRISESGFGVVKFLILPGFSLGLMQSGLIAKTTRSSMLNVLSQDYIRTAYAKGLPPHRRILVHSLRNAMGPIVTVIGFSLAILLGGTWIIETIFNIPGIGGLATTAISRRDYPLIQGCMLFSTFIYLVVNLLVDISYPFFNPYVKYK